MIDAEGRKKLKRKLSRLENKLSYLYHYDPSGIERLYEEWIVGANEERDWIIYESLKDILNVNVKPTTARAFRDDIKLKAGQWATDGKVWISGGYKSE